MIGIIKKIISYCFKRLRNLNFIPKELETVDSIKSNERSFYNLLILEDEPIKIEDNIIYLIGENSNYWLVLFACPCGCNQGIYLNLLPDHEPSWSVHLSNNGKISISPSIWRIVGCKSHFYIRNNRVIWTKYFSSKER